MINFFSTSIKLMLVVAALSGAALACSCPTVMSLEDEIKWKLKNGSAVFSGEVMSIRASGGLNHITFKVIEFWKGRLTSELTVSTHHNTAACGYDFTIRKRYLVFTDLWENRRSTGACSKNRELEKAGAELKILGKGQRPTTPGLKE